MLFTGVLLAAAFGALAVVAYEARPVPASPLPLAAEPVTTVSYHRPPAPDHNIAAMYTRPIEPAQPPRTASTVNLHLGPSDNYVVLGTLPKGAAIEVVGRDESADWLAIAFPPNSSFRAWLPQSEVVGMPEVDELPIAPVRLLP